MGGDEDYTFEDLIGDMDVTQVELPQYQVEELLWEGFEELNGKTEFGEIMPLTENKNA